uniref:Uncharacterized protein n=1 Tax=Anopheles farauti TaxID=69004 RepID=A0A182QID1_9DIPT
MADLSSFQRSSPLRTPVRISKLKLYKQKQLATDVPPLARQLLRSLNNNDRRNSLSARLAIGRTSLRCDSAWPLDQSCMDQFDDSFAPELDAVQPLTPRKSPHLLRRGSLTRLGSKKRIAHTTTAATMMQVGGLSSIVSSRKTFGGVRKRVMNSVRKMLLPRRTSSGYKKL